MEARYIERPGTIVRGEYGLLARVVDVIERTRMSERHVTSPGDVVVTVEPVGPGYGHRSSWASKLTPAAPGDVGAHPCHTGGYGWRHVPASWEGGSDAAHGCDRCRAAESECATDDDE